MEIFLLASKENREAALSGAFQSMLPNQGRLIFGIGAVLAAPSPGQRRSRAKQFESLLQESVARSAAELWSSLLKKLPETSQQIIALGVINEEGALELRVSRVRSVLIKSEQKQRLIAIQNGAIQIPADILAGATALLFLEDDVEQAEEIAALLQETEQILGGAAVRSLLSPRTSESVITPVSTPTTASTPIVTTPTEPPPANPWQRHAPWGVAALTTSLWLFSLVGGPTTQTVVASKPAVIDTKPKFIPQEDEPVVVETKKPEKKITKEEPSSAPQSQETKEPTTPVTKTPTTKPAEPTKNTKPPVKKTTKKK
jgi:hypothetical protein